MTLNSTRRLLQHHVLLAHLLISGRCYIFRVTL